MEQWKACSETTSLPSKAKLDCSFPALELQADLAFLWAPLLLETVVLNCGIVAEVFSSDDSAEKSKLL